MESHRNLAVNNASLEDFSIPSTTRILVAEDDPLLGRALKNVLRRSGYIVKVVDQGRAVLHEIEVEMPDLLILDVGLPDMSGYDVCREVKKDRLYRSIPIVMVTGYADLNAKLKGFSGGVDDYLTKPFRVQELLARLQAIFTRCRSNLEASPLTHLPGNGLLERDILGRIKRQTPFAVLYCDLNNFKEFNDYYGFVRGDNLLRMTARVLLEVTDARQDFVGHVGGDDFVVVSSVDGSEALCKSILTEFDRRVPGFYDVKDREKGSIRVKDRRGKERSYPFVSMAIGGVSSKSKPLSSLGEVSSIGAEMKHFAKKHKKSFYAFDQRQD